jgi:hypothetical protein
MHIHQNARTTPQSRAELVRRGLEAGHPVSVVAREPVSRPEPCGSGWIAFASRACPGCTIARRAPIAAPGPSRPTWWPASWPCGAAGGRVRKSRPSSASVKLPWRSDFGTRGSPGCGRSSPSGPSSAMSAPSRGSCSVWITQPLGRIGHRITGIGGLGHAGSAGSMRMSASTTPRGSHTRSSCPRRPLPPARGGGFMPSVGRT